MTNWIVHPVSSPEHLKNAEANLARQRCAGAKTLIVENAEAVGLWNGPCDAKLISAPGKGHAINAGLAYLQHINATSWRVFDEDDWYSDLAAYQAFRTLRLTGAHLVGQSRSWVVVDGELWFVRYPETRVGVWKNKPPLDLWGGAIGGQVRSFQPFDPDLIGITEDCVQWTTRRMSEGQRMAMTCDHECFVRSSLSVWQCSDSDTLKALIQPRQPPAVYFGRVPPETREGLVSRRLQFKDVPHREIHPHGSAKE